MSSYKLLQATAPSVINTNGGTSLGGTSTSYNISGGYGISGQVLATSTISDFTAGNLTAASFATADRTELSVVNGEPQLRFQETQSDGTRVRATFEPDSSMAPIDAARINLLMTLMMQQGHALMNLKPITYIRKHNLERHFRFEQA